ncbi:MAG: hypothetical protein K0A94_03180 [Desulfuromonadales bacterium]|nr:hypothetical protein [Desulfuromonadales bacterium]
MINYLVVCLAVVLIGALYSEADARARGLGIIGSAHDFTYDASSSGTVNEWNSTGVAGTYWDSGDGEACRVCHVPHDQGGSAWYSWDGEDAGLLWNHSLSNTDVYGMYGSDSLRGEIGANVAGKSKLCLSCHDGTVAINAFDDQQGTGGFGNDGVAEADRVWIQDYASAFEIGPGRSVADDNFLMGNHPISVAYAEGFFTQNPKVGMNGGLHAPEGRTFGNLVKMRGAPTVDMVLEQGMVQCHSCHDVHDSPGVTAIGTALNRAGQGLAANSGSDPSGLCLSCHAK